MTRYFQRHPIKTEGREELARYLCELHNVLNKFLKKPIFDCNLLEETYGGECDECKVRGSFIDEF